MTAKVPISDSGTVMPGISVAHRLRRNRKITITTSAMVSISVNWTSSTEARMVWVRSVTMWTSMAGGIDAFRRGSAALMCSTVSMTLTPGCRWMIRIIDGCPL